MRSVVLIRGINIAGKNPVPMAGLRSLLEELGCTEVATLQASGNAVVTSALSSKELGARLEKALPSTFKLTADAVKVLALGATTFRAIIDARPKGFGDEPDKYYSDVIFLMGISVASVMKLAEPREGVDTAWPGKNVIYWRRLTALRTKTRLSKLMTGEPYRSMTVRSWSTTAKLADML
jgi:uncharacterized protein (DUF1697 family)